MRDSERNVLLRDVLRQLRADHRFEFKGQRYRLSDGGIDQVVGEISSTGLNDGLLPANEAIHKKLTLGVTITEFVDGQKISVTVPLIDWDDIDVNTFQVTEELSVERPSGMGRFRPDVVC